MISFNPAAAQKRLSVQNYPGNYKYQKSDKSCSQLGFINMLQLILCWWLNLSGLLFRLKTIQTILVEV